jgi:hypothetical protein
LRRRFDTPTAIKSCAFTRDAAPFRHAVTTGILSAKQAEDLLHFTRNHFPGFLLVIVLGLFSGIRAEDYSIQIRGSKPVEQRIPGDG